MTPLSSLQARVHRFWQRRSLWHWPLLPLSALVYWYTERKRRRYQHANLNKPSSKTPVIVVGNLIVGGAGKTPVTLALLHQLREHGYTPGVISRGYGVNIGTAPHASAHSKAASYLGDEPALIAQTTHTPVVVHPQRVLALQSMNAHFPEVDVVVSDDGLQHRQLARNVEIIVQDQRGLGNGWVLPAGPLRESPKVLAQADLVITQGVGPNRLTTASHFSEVRMYLWPIRFYSLHQPDYSVQADEALTHWKDSKLAAAAAIGQPQRFFEMLRQFGFSLTQQLALPDHYDYATPPFGAVHADYIFITAKDAVKCRDLNDPRLWVVEAESVFSTPDWYQAVLSKLPPPTP